MSCIARTATVRRCAIRSVGVLGGSPDAVRYAQIVRQWADDVLYFAPTATLRAAERAQLVARAIEIV